MPKYLIFIKDDRYEERDVHDHIMKYEIHKTTPNHWDSANNLHNAIHKAEKGAQLAEGDAILYDDEDGFIVEEVPHQLLTAEQL